MDRAWTVLLEGGGVGGSDVPLVGQEVVDGVVLVKPRHDAVPGHLGNHRGSGDARRDPVPLPDREPGDLEAVDREPVGQHVRRSHLELGCAAPERLQVRDVHAEPVALVVLPDDHRPGQRPAQHLGVRPITSLGGEQLGVGQAGNLPPLAIREHHRGGDKWTGTRASAGLVDARNRVEAYAPQRSLVSVETGVLANGQASGQRTHETSFVPHGPTTFDSVPAAGYGTESNVAGVCRSFACESGQTTANTLPTTSSVGTCPPPGSPRWTRESAEFDRLSPWTQTYPGFTLTSKSISDGRTPAARYAASFSGTPLPVIRPRASQHLTSSPPTPITRFTR